MDLMAEVPVFSSPCVFSENKQLRNCMELLRILKVSPALGPLLTTPHPQAFWAGMVKNCQESSIKDMYKLSRSNCIFQRTSISHVIVLWSLLQSTLVGMVGFSWFFGIYISLPEGMAENYISASEMTTQGISRQLAPKPLLRQLKRRPMRPTPLTLEKFARKSECRKGYCRRMSHVFLQKIIINQQRPLSADLLIPELEKTLFQGKPTTQKNNAVSFTVQAF